MPTQGFTTLMDRVSGDSGQPQILSAVGITAGLLVFTFGMAAAALTGAAWLMAPVLAIALVTAFSVRVAKQWERGAVLRFGRYKGLRGPGLFFIIPIVESVSRYVDQRVRVTDVSAETALTKDTVPVNVDAIVFWVVWDAEKAILEVQSFFNAVSLCSQTSLLESIGRHELAELIAQREKLGHELQRILDEKTNPWGITIQSVEIRDVRIPLELQDAMSRQAQAEREKQARVILGSAEAEIAGKFVEAAKVYADHPAALQLRAMNIIYETTKERGTTILMPTSMVDSMNPAALSLAGQAPALKSVA